MATKIKPKLKRSDSTASHDESKPAIKYKDKDYFVGMKLEAMETDGKWYNSRIVSVDKAKRLLLVHFDGWNPKYDIWLPPNSERLRLKALEKQRKWRVGERIVARWGPAGKIYPATITKLTDDERAEVLFYDGFKKVLKISSLQPDTQRLYRKYVYGNAAIKEFAPPTKAPLFHPVEFSKVEIRPELINMGRAKRRPTEPASMSDYVRNDGGKKTTENVLSKQDKQDKAISVKKDEIPIQKNTKASITKAKAIISKTTKQVSKANKLLAAAKMSKLQTTLNSSSKKPQSKFQSSVFKVKKSNTVKPILRETRRTSRGTATSEKITDEKISKGVDNSKQDLGTVLKAYFKNKAISEKKGETSGSNLKPEELGTSMRLRRSKKEDLTTASESINTNKVTSLSKNTTHESSKTTELSNKTITRSHQTTSESNKTTTQSSEAATRSNITSRRSNETAKMSNQTTFASNKTITRSHDTSFESNKTSTRSSNKATVIPSSTTLRSTKNTQGPNNLTSEANKTILRSNKISSKVSTSAPNKINSGHKDTNSKLQNNQVTSPYQRQYKPRIRKSSSRLNENLSEKPTDDSNQLSVITHKVVDKPSTRLKRERKNIRNSSNEVQIDVKQDITSTSRSVADKNSKLEKPTNNILVENEKLISTPLSSVDQSSVVDNKSIQDVVSESSKIEVLSVKKETPQVKRDVNPTNFENTSLDLSENVRKTKSSEPVQMVTRGFNNRIKLLKKQRKQKVFLSGMATRKKKIDTLKLISSRQRKPRNKFDRKISEKNALSVSSKYPAKIAKPLINKTRIHIAEKQSSRMHTRRQSMAAPAFQKNLQDVDRKRRRSLRSSQNETTDLFEKNKAVMEVKSLRSSKRRSSEQLMDVTADIVQTIEKVSTASEKKEKSNVIAKESTDNSTLTIKLPFKQKQKHNKRIKKLSQSSSANEDSKNSDTTSATAPLRNDSINVQIPSSEDSKDNFLLQPSTSADQSEPTAEIFDSSVEISLTEKNSAERQETTEVYVDSKEGVDPVSETPHADETKDKEKETIEPSIGVTEDKDSVDEKEGIDEVPEVDNLEQSKENLTDLNNKKDDKDTSMELHTTDKEDHYELNEPLSDGEVSSDGSEMNLVIDIDDTNLQKKKKIKPTGTINLLNVQSMDINQSISTDNVETATDPFVPAPVKKMMRKSTSKYRLPSFSEEPNEELAKQQEKKQKQKQISPKSEKATEKTSTMKQTEISKDTLSHRQPRKSFSKYRDISKSVASKPQEKAEKVDLKVKSKLDLKTSKKSPIKKNSEQQSPIKRDKSTNESKQPSLKTSPETSEARIPKMIIKYEKEKEENIIGIKYKEKKVPKDRRLSKESKMPSTEISTELQETIADEKHKEKSKSKDVSVERRSSRTSSSKYRSIGSEQSSLESKKNRTEEEKTHDDKDVVTLNSYTSTSNISSSMRSSHTEPKDSLKIDTPAYEETLIDKDASDKIKPIETEIIEPEIESLSEAVKDSDGNKTSYKAEKNERLKSKTSQKISLVDFTSNETLSSDQEEKLETFSETLKQKSEFVSQKKPAATFVEELDTCVPESTIIERASLSENSDNKGTVSLNDKEDDELQEFSSSSRRIKGTEQPPQDSNENNLVELDSSKSIADEICVEDSTVAKPQKEAVNNNSVIDIEGSSTFETEYEHRNDIDVQQTNVECLISKEQNKEVVSLSNYTSETNIVDETSPSKVDMTNKLDTTQNDVDDSTEKISLTKSKQFDDIVANKEDTSESNIIEQSELSFVSARSPRKSYSKYRVNQTEVKQRPLSFKERRMESMKKQKEAKKNKKLEIKGKQNTEKQRFEDKYEMFKKKWKVEKEKRRKALMENNKRANELLQQEITPSSSKLDSITSSSIAISSTNQNNESPNLPALSLTDAGISELPSAPITKSKNEMSKNDQLKVKFPSIAEGKQSVVHHPKIKITSKSGRRENLKKRTLPPSKQSNKQNDDQEENEEIEETSKVEIVTHKPRGRPRKRRYEDKDEDYIPDPKEMDKIIDTSRTPNMEETLSLASMVSSDRPSLKKRAPISLSTYSSLPKTYTQSNVTCQPRINQSQTIRFMDAFQPRILSATFNNRALYNRPFFNLAVPRYPLSASQIAALKIQNKIHHQRFISTFNRCGYVPYRPFLPTQFVNIQPRVPYTQSTTNSKPNMEETNLSPKNDIMSSGISNKANNKEDDSDTDNEIITVNPSDENLITENVTSKSEELDITNIALSKAVQSPPAKLVKRRKTLDSITADLSQNKSSEELSKAPTNITLQLPKLELKETTKVQLFPSNLEKSNLLKANNNENEAKAKVTSPIRLSDHTSLTIIQNDEKPSDESALKNENERKMSEQNKDSGKPTAVKSADATSIVVSDIRKRKRRRKETPQEQQTQQQQPYEFREKNKKKGSNKETPPLSVTPVRENIFDEPFIGLYTCKIKGCEKAFRKKHLLEYHRKYFHTAKIPQKRSRSSSVSVSSTDSTPTTSSPAGRSQSSDGTPLGDHSATTQSEYSSSEDESELSETEELPSVDDCVKCVCQDDCELGFMIQCEQCFTWQHGECVGYSQQKSVPLFYLCHICSNPKGLRKSQKYNNDYTWYRHGKLPPAMSSAKNDEGQSTVRECDEDVLSNIVLVTHSMMSELYNIRNVIQSVRSKYLSLRSSDNPYMKKWKEEKLYKLNDASKNTSSTTSAINSTPHDNTSSHDDVVPGYIRRFFTEIEGGNGLKLNGHCANEVSKYDSTSPTQNNKESSTLKKDSNKITLNDFSTIEGSVDTLAKEPQKSDIADDLDTTHDSIHTSDTETAYTDEDSIPYGFSDAETNDKPNSTAENKEQSSEAEILDIDNANFLRCEGLTKDDVYKVDMSEESDEDLVARYFVLCEIERIENEIEDRIDDLNKKLDELENEYASIDRSKDILRDFRAKFKLPNMQSLMTYLHKLKWTHLISSSNNSSPPKSVTSEATPSVSQ